jgi:hypothetical protein
MDLLFTFGKHAGHTIMEVIQDDSYYDWLKRQDWWPDKWEAKVIDAYYEEKPIPPQPRVRPILEVEYDSAEGRPNKVRRLTHKQFERRERFMCAGCSGNKVHMLRTGAYRCEDCGAHTKLVNVLEENGTMTLSWVLAECPSYGTEVQRKEATRYCSENKGSNADHTSCGCWVQFQCNCSCASGRCVYCTTEGVESCLHSR